MEAVLAGENALIVVGWFSVSLPAVTGQQGGEVI
jgi:hypothetical protein